MDEAVLLPRGVEIERDESTDRYRVRYDSSEELPSTVVVTAVAAVAETDPLDLEPLRESIDPDALDALFRQTPGGRIRSSGQAEFWFADHHVTVDATGEIEVTPER
ncbi:HalOD1 output domain-containing protein [Halorussus ruber]|uniref:HalOD1 output domain-containing protein n=1 Tax=Halorussus ruber TaxID=1126238 RepID=UPI0010924490|nr:HalOD1 output domain-containing protein [Halorussus ruber]